MTTAVQRLADVRKAIHEVLTTGQSIRKDGRELRLAELSSLRQLEKQYEHEATAESQAKRRKPRNRVFYGAI